MSSAQELIEKATEIVSEMPNAEQVTELKNSISSAKNILDNLDPIFKAFTANLEIVSGSIVKNTALVSTLKESLRNLIEKTKDNATIMDIITKFMNQFDSIFKGDGKPLQKMIESKKQLDGLIISLEQEIAGNTDTDTTTIQEIRNSLKKLTDAYASISPGGSIEALDTEQNEAEEQKMAIAMAAAEEEAERSAAERQGTVTQQGETSGGGKRRKSKRKTKKGGRKRKSKKRKSRRKRKSKRKSKKKSKRTKKR
jgi:hypothetical protein